MPETDGPGHRHLRFTARDDIVVPRTNTKMSGRQSFAVKEPVIWNGLRPCICNCDKSMDRQLLA